MHFSSDQSAMSRYFAGLTEHAFHGQLGVCDTELVDYVSGLLIRFVRNDDVFKIRGLSGRRLDVVLEMLGEAEERVGQARRDVHRHIGDFTLFWTGLFPEAVEKRQAGSATNNYTALGKRAYYIASTIETDDQRDAPSELLGRLSERFELCAYGLQEVRREWDRRDEPEPPFLIN